jgi:hypothetical protein
MLPVWPSAVGHIIAVLRCISLVEATDAEMV